MFTRDELSVPHSTLHDLSHLYFFPAILLFSSNVYIELDKFNVFLITNV